MQIQGFCYGFVEFEEATAVQSAIEVVFLSFDHSILSGCLVIVSICSSHTNFDPIL